MTQIPVLWLCGPPGVGKTAVAWTIYSRLLDTGAHPAYVDVDQVGICYPEARDDPDRHRLKARNLGVLRANFARAGRRCLIVSGVVAADHGPELTSLGGGGVTVVRLSVDPVLLRSRLDGRLGTAPDVDAVRVEAQALERSTFAEWSIDTTGLSIDDVAGRVRGRLGSWPPPAGHRRPEQPLREEGDGADRGGNVVFVCGPTGVGKSTVGFRAYATLLRGGATVGFADVDQLCFAGSRSVDHELRASNLARVWANFRDAGATTLVAVGPVSSRAEAQLYEHRMPNATFYWYRLAARPETLRARILSRGRGGSWPQPGDPLVGLTEERLREVHDDAVADSHRLESLDVGVRVDADALGAEQAAHLIAERFMPGDGRR